MAKSKRRSRKGCSRVKVKGHVVYMRRNSKGRFTGKCR